MHIPEVLLPFESFRYRANHLRRTHVLRFCDRCLRNRRRCRDSKKNRTNHTISWKAHRSTQYHPK